MLEKEYIDLEEAVATLKHNSLKCFNSYYKGYVNAIEDLADIPPADVAPVVRCKDCIYSSFVSHCSKYECGRLEDILFFSDDFCSYGKRKENYNG